MIPTETTTSMARRAPETLNSTLAPAPRPAWSGRAHVLDLDDFTAGEIEAVLQNTAAMKEILRRPVGKVPALRGKTVVNVFYEASTRTRVSFELAAKNLGADVVSVAASTSSVTKGESLLDTVRTLRALGADLVVIRHSEAGAPYLVARHVDAHVINAGDGWHAHPTQALLDLFTIRERLGRIAGLKIVILGDILHSRVARSNAWGLARMGARVVFCGPPTLMPPGTGERYGGSPWQVEVELDPAVALDGADVVMALRLQRERQTGGLLPSLREYSRVYGLNRDRLALAKPGALIMHPGPMNEGVEIEPDVAHSLESAIEQQVTNGVAVRMALLYLLFGGEQSGSPL